MKKLFILSLIAPAVLGLAACNGNKGGDNVGTTNDLVSNADDFNLSDDLNTVDANATVPTENVANAN